MTIDEATRQLLAAAITARVLEIVDKEAEDVPGYQLFRPLLVSSLLLTAYRSVESHRTPPRPSVVSNRAVERRKVCPSTTSPVVVSQKGTGRCGNARD